MAILKTVLVLGGGVALMMASTISVATAFQPSAFVRPSSYYSPSLQRTTALFPLRASANQQQPIMETTLSELMYIPVQTLEQNANADSSNGADSMATFQNTIPLGDILQKYSSPLILSCLTHFGDFNAWELTQQYMAAIDSGKLKRPIVLVGIGSIESAQKFSDDLDLRQKYQDRITLVADETGAVTDALGCYKGWLTLEKSHADRWQQTQINPYVRLLGMIFGFGSPGTIPQVLYGYVGDLMNSNGSFGRQWVVDSLLQGSEKGRFPVLTEEAFDGVPLDSKLRPFELATLRLQTGLHIVGHWGKLGPKDGDLFTRMGGTFVFEKKGECTWHHYDTGILAYANVNDVCELVEGRGNDDDLFVVTKLEGPQDEEIIDADIENKQVQQQERSRVEEEDAARQDADTKLAAAQEARRQSEEDAARVKSENDEAAKIVELETNQRAELQREAKELAKQEKRIKAEEKATRIAAVEEETRKAEEVSRQAEEEAELAAAKEAARLAELSKRSRKAAEEAVLAEVEERTRQAYLSHRSLLEARLQREAKELAEHEERIQAEEEEAEIAAMEEEYREAEEASIQVEEEARLAAAEEATRQAYRSQRSLLETRLQHEAIGDAAGRKIANKAASPYLGALEEASKNKKTIIPASSYLNMLRQTDLPKEDEQVKADEKAVAAEIAALERIQADEKAAVEAAVVAAAEETNRKSEEARRKGEEEKAKKNILESAASDQEQSASARSIPQKSISSFLDELNKEFSNKKVPAAAQTDAFAAKKPWRQDFGK
mmetsp:Transcript_3414/g.5641  ORF Transcript_3414/g.5641 Transcript_3414/m.5641 type:complete len:778 (-) Transcript_3414:38-2371(-)|eukprot:CAMPEP_0119017632 /NCGR_PEP_ID=MMETSP1176-20130426/17180_1 /TAXON_ID=265551 /ORGANISM="Synedropsis recta cf, Strain CCMP1620" /LENGTH=777 /DNA_ID=CAMNT_0006971409 /DNA_START=95 /DNA_END=2428 /DNA_ORIENTATION=+